MNEHCPDEPYSRGRAARLWIAWYLDRESTLNKVLALTPPKHHPEATAWFDCHLDACIRDWQTLPSSMPRPSKLFENMVECLAAGDDPEEIFSFIGVAAISRWGLRAATRHFS